jgi:hypothetical protein
VAAIAGLIMVALAACAPAASEPVQPTPTAEPTTPATLEEPIPVDSAEGFFFPVQPPVEGERDVMEALLTGTLQEEMGCLRVVAGEDSYLPIWPPGYSLTAEIGTPQVLNESGEVVATIGQEVNLGGGVVPDDVVEADRDDLPH